MAKQHIKVKHAGMSDIAPTSGREAEKVPKSRGKLFWCCGTLLILFILFVAAYFVVAQNLAHQYLTEGNKKFNEHLYTEANKDFIFAGALAFFGWQTDADAFAGQAAVANVRGDHATAAEFYKKAINKKSNDNLVQEYGEQLFALQKYSEAAAELSKIQEPSDSVLYLLAHCELHQDNFDQAKTYIEKLSSDGNHAVAKNEHLAYFALRDHSADFLSLYPKSRDQKFLAYAEKALKTKSYSSVDYVTLGNFLLINGEEDFALDFAKSALQIENNYRDALVLQAQAYAARKQYDQAEASLSEAMTTSLLNEDIWYLQAQVQAAQGDKGAALSSYKKASELGQNTALFHFAFAKVAKDNNDADLAISETKKALVLDPENFRVYLSFNFWAALDAENYDAALDAAKQYVKRAPGEEFGILAQALAEYKLQNRGNFSDVIEKVMKINQKSAFLKYLQAIDSMDQHFEFDKKATQKLFIEAIDYDTNSGSSGEVAKHAQKTLENL